MVRSFCRLWVHGVFGTKHRQSFITEEMEHDLYNYLSDQLKKIECVPLNINGTQDHVHVLFLANYKMSTMDIMKQIKGSSSYWINKNKLTNHRFEWQDGFGAFSVSEQNVLRVKNYITNQKVHHWKKTFQEEYDEFIANIGDFRDLHGAG